MSEAFAVRGRVVTPDSILVDGAIVIQDQEIIWIGEAPEAQAAGFGAQVVAADSPTDGRYILPGLVDVHCHGGGGQSFPDAKTADEALTAVWEHRLHGTTTLVTSLVTQSPEVLRRQAQMLADLADAGEIAGIHFEGPFVSEAHKGAQDAHYIQAPNPALTRELMIVTRNHTVTMTLAPEEKRAFGSGSVAEVLIENGALPSYGHTDCDSETMRNAALWTREKLGLTPEGVRRSPRYTITHLFNGMEPFHHRQPGPVLEAIADAAGGGAVLELIGDGVHLHPDAVRAVYELVGRDSIVFVTDAMAAAGVADGDYVLGGQAVIVQEGRAYLRNEDGSTGSLAGGTAHLLDVVRNSWRNSGLPLIDAVYCASMQGAKILGESERIGSLQAGKLADMVVVDENLYPLQVYRRGIQVASVPTS
ncbi:N-acetylglucosamine-6-phosphate deacetylase [Mobiluncus mulieris]|uniref:N-acetylglucosamine-6-phosphate deacetylase n=2 Tax=Mobiluncus mulieris TaxID=2052 RepID=E0QPG9_9ACTO|nr:amidohydrolase family protein [Mobiluncus mulieris]EEJ54875.1 putative N-acetylglucosamine-6-phosphate deacetylase [Mobiluncus mulieris ATCC 35243]EFM46529.1 putative N-acetylglucosamine-6-phosphate deacetylase [Mobiluncus mulieris ATCC 35239]MBB5846790.1 N-acetylglucosamine-6-phosphate deacetylase [Mobiluncus mulieris]MCU9968857.1 amidohydrolase family protein [Mobiluncus mulieris]MCU9972096.1 amidohydrolase family protein [Mobiluncus mulieris]